MATKHFVLIHDAGHGKWIWEKLKPLLEEHGHVVTTIDLRASGDDPLNIEYVASADDYTTPLLEVLEDLPKGVKVILVGHGFGGINAAIAMDMDPDKVELAVFLNALLPDTTNRPSFVIEEGGGVASANECTTPLLDEFKKLHVNEKVILVAHGFSGINAAIAMDKYPYNVDLAVFLNALSPDTTHRPSYVIEEYLKKFSDWKDCEFSSYIINKGAISKFKLGKTFVKDNLFPRSTAKDKEQAMSKVRIGTFFPEPLAVRENFTEAGYGSIPKVFISSQQDIAIPTKFQQWELDNYPMKVYPLEGDHSPMYYDPKALLDKILQIINGLST